LGFQVDGYRKQRKNLERQFRELREILVSDENEGNAVDKVFVYLARDTSRSKKILREIVENAFTGEDRKNVMRKIVPIVVAQGLAEQGGKDERVYGDGITQFKDDLTYFQDNFAGVGLWYLPLMPNPGATEDEVAKDGAEKDGAEKDGAEKNGAAEGESSGADTSVADVNTIRVALTERLQKNSDFVFLGETIDSYLIQLCEFACPNRWVFRITLDVLVGLLLVYAGLAWMNCRLREFYQRRRPFFMAYLLLTALVVMVSKVCDPGSKEILNFLIAVAFLFIGWGYFRRFWQPKLY
jgi:hypothetical protein